MKLLKEKLKNKIQHLTINGKPYFMNALGHRVCNSFEGEAEVKFKSGNTAIYFTWLCASDGMRNWKFIRSL